MSVDVQDRASVLPGRTQTLATRLGLRSLRDYGIVASFIALFVFLSVSTDKFLTTTNLLNILDQSAPIGIVAVGGTLVLIAGGLDLSVGAIYAFCGVIAAEAAGPLGVPGGLAAGVLCGLGLGALNGTLVTAGRINSFIGTLGSGIIFRGFALAITAGSIVAVDQASFATLGTGEVLGVKYSIVVWAVFAGLVGLLLWRSRWGRYIYATGANPAAARLSGVRVGVVRASTFAISGLAAGLAGVIVASRVATGQADVGTGFELTAIAAIVVGGTSIQGGDGAVWRTIVGVLLLALIGNGLNLLNVSPTYQQIIQGAILLAAVGIDAWTRRGRA